MAACDINEKINLSDYTKLGLTMQDVHQYFLETGMIGSPESVKYRLDRVENGSVPEIKEDVKQLNKNTRVLNNSVNKWITKLNNSLSVTHNIISLDEAYALHAEKGKPYNQEPAFFYNGEVYFVNGQLNTESVIHEFMHPFVKMLINNNKELFDKLYDQLNETEEGKNLIAKVTSLYSDANQDTLREEVLVRSLTESLLLTEHKPAFHAWLTDFMVAIKQMLRKLIGKKIQIHTLSPTTTIKDLAGILAKGEIVEMDSAVYTDEEIFNYLRDYKNFIETFNNTIKGEEVDVVQAMINNTADIAFSQIRSMKSVPELENLASLLTDEYDNQLLDKIKTDLGKLSTKNDLIQAIGKKDNRGLVAAENVVRERLTTLTNNLFKVKEVLEIMNNYLEKVEKLDSKEQINTLFYYTSYLKAWSKVVDQLENSRAKYGTRGDAFSTLASELRDLRNTAVNKIDTLKVDAVLDVMYEQLKPSGDRAMERFKEVDQFKKNAPQVVRDNHYKSFHNMTEGEYKEYQKLKSEGKTSTREYITLHNKWLLGAELTKDKLRQVLKAEVPDANKFNVMLEQVSLSTDPAIHSVYQFIQSRIAEYEIIAKDKFEGYVEAVTPHIEKNGAQFQTRGSLGKKFGFKDRVASVKDGVLIESEEWTFLNPWKDYKVQQTTLNHAVTKARSKFNETNSTEDEALLNKALEELEDWTNKYMHREFSAEYYIPNKLLTKDQIGLDAKEQRDVIFTDMQNVEDSEDLTYEEKRSLIDSSWRKYDLLKSLHNPDGTKKTGDALAIAERLKEYSEAKSKFSSFREIPGEFQRAYNDYVNDLKERGIPKEVEVKGVMTPNETYTKLLEQWIEDNTTVALKNSIVDAKQKLLTRREELLVALVELNKSIYDDSEDHNLIADMVKLITDKGTNQPDGYLASAEVRLKVKAAHEKLEAMSDKLYNYKAGGLNKTESKRLEVLQKLDDDGIINSAEITEKKQLLAKQLNIKGQLGLTQGMVAELQAIDGALSKLSSKNPTVAFKNAMVDIFLNDDVLYQQFVDYFEEQGLTFTSKDEFEGDVEPKEFVEFIRKSDVDALKKANSSLKDFIEQNFYEEEVYSYDDSNYINQLTLTKLWLNNSGNNLLDYKTKMLKDENGNKLGLIKDKDGNFRYPTLAYQQRIVKDEYVTEKIVGKTVDNRGRFLPKEEPSNMYRNAEYYRIKEEEPDMFAFMEELKSQFLSSQELANDYDKLYLTYPQTRKTRLENVVTGNLFQYGRRVKEYWYGAGDDLEEMGITSELNSKDLVAETKDEVLEHADASMPVKGVARLRSYKDVSTDILKTMPEYMASVYHKEGARQAASYARSVDEVTVRNDKSKSADRKDMPAVDETARQHNTSNFWDKRGSKVRKDALEAIIARDLDGVYLKGDGRYVYKSQKALNAMNRSVGFKLFSLNPGSAIKNYNQIKLVSLTHALASDEINLYDGMVGEVWALKAAGEISKNIRSRGNKGYNEQLAQLFDPIGGRTMETMGDNLSRTVIGDMFDLKFLQNGRKWLELQGGLQNFGALMNNKKVAITQNGKTKMIPYLNAFELVDGRLQSKKGLDPGYAISYDSEGKLIAGQKLIDERLRMQQIIATWNGTFAKKDSSLIERNIIAKQLIALRKHFIPMTAKNYAFSVGTHGNIVKKRMNWTTGKVEYGHFTSTLKTLTEVLTTFGRSVPTLTKEEIVSMTYVTGYLVVGTLLLPLITNMLTIFKAKDDDDDEDLPKKLDYRAMKARSGYLSFDDDGITVEDKYDFHLDGFLLNHAGLIMSQTTDEFNSMNMFTYHGFKEFAKTTNPNAINLTIQINLALKLLAYETNQKSDTYTKDSGPYFFQQGGYKSGKTYDALFDLVGINGKNLDPVKGREDYESFKATN